MPENEHSKVKEAIRADIKQRLAEMEPGQMRTASIQACERLTALEVYRHAQVIMLYMPLAGEVDLTPLALRCFQVGKTVCAPKVDWQRKDMTPVEVTTFDDRVMDTDEHGVRVPRDGRLVSPALIDLIIVPGLAFDAHGHRLGRGGGYYDRFLARLRPGTVKIGLAFDPQMIDAVPMEINDVPVDIVVTERRVTQVHPSRTGR
jgi:5-formyltetrahydrofolate cyclo-ligase